MKKRNLLVAPLVVASMLSASATGAGAQSAQADFGAVKKIWANPALRTQFVDSASDETLIDFVQRAHFEWFRRNANPDTGLVLDRDNADSPASIAATGFSLTAHIVAAEHGWITKQEAREYACKTLSGLAQTPQGADKDGRSGNWGLYYHFLNPNTGLRATKNSGYGWSSELSTIDTALLVAGVLSARNYFNSESNASEKQLRDDANFIVDRVQWDKFLTKDKLIAMAWTPDEGTSQSVYRGYSEALLLYVIALGSHTHPIPAESWHAFIGDATPAQHYGKDIIPMPGMPLFCYQYPHGFIDFRDIFDDVNRRVGFDYYENARRVTEVHHAYAIDNPNNFRGYGPLDWGLTACDGPADSTKESEGRQVTFRRYSERGGPNGFDDGTIAPTAAMSAMPYHPKLVVATMRYWLKQRPELFDPEKGFVDAFNPTYDPTSPSGWVDAERIGIDQGPIVIAFENARSQLIWNLMKQDQLLLLGLTKAGFQGGWLDKEIASKPEMVR